MNSDDMRKILQPNSRPKSRKPSEGVNYYNVAKGVLAGRIQPQTNDVKNSVLEQFKNSDLLEKELTHEEMENLLVFWETLSNKDMILLFTYLASKDTVYRNIKLWYGKNMPTSGEKAGAFMARICEENPNLTEEIAWSPS